MNSYKYTGPKVNLGRFGPVEPGQVLLLTDREEECIKGDKRFKAVKAEVSKPEQAKILKQEVAEMNREQLVAYCKELQAVDPQFQFKEDMPHDVLLAKVRHVMDQTVRNPEPAKE